MFEVTLSFTTYERNDRRVAISQANFINHWHERALLRMCETWGYTNDAMLTRGFNLSHEGKKIFLVELFYLEKKQILKRFPMGYVLKSSLMTMTDEVRDAIKNVAKAKQNGEAGNSDEE